MSKELLEEYRNKTEQIMTLKRAPSQFSVFIFLLESGKIMSVREISESLQLTPKATERAVSKLVDKGLVKRSTFREASYTVDSNQILLSLLLNSITLNEALQSQRNS